jgi:hypothetical protein
MVSLNHGPAWGLSEPYSAMLMRIVPRLINQAGINRLSVGWRIDDRKVEGWNLNLKDIMEMLKTKRTMLSMKKKQPIVYLPWKSQGTEGDVSAVVVVWLEEWLHETYNGISRLQCLQWPSGHYNQQGPR